MNVEHLWHCNESDGAAAGGQQHRSNSGGGAASSSSSSSGKSTTAHNNGDGGGGNNHSNGNSGGGGTAAEGDSVSSLCSIADHRLYKIVKWCKSLPLFKNIQVRIHCGCHCPFRLFNSIVLVGSRLGRLTTRFRC
jgi:hypothetical protein